MSDFKDEVSELKMAQRESHTLLKVLTKKVEKYMDGDDDRHKELVKFQVETSRNLATVAAILQETQKKADTAAEKTIPALQTSQAAHSSILKMHTWFIRAVIGVTVIAVLGTSVVSMATCHTGSVSAQTIEVKDAGFDEGLDVLDEPNL